MKLLTILYTILLISTTITTSQQIAMSDDNMQEVLKSLEGKTPEDIMIDVGNGKRVPLSKVNKPHEQLRGPNRHGILHNLMNRPIEPQVRKQEEEWEAQHGQQKKNDPILEPGSHKPIVDVDSFPDVEPDVRKLEHELENQRIQKNAILDPGSHKPVIDVDSFPEVEPNVKKQEEELEKERDLKHGILNPAVHKAIPDVSSFPEVDDSKKND